MRHPMETVPKDGKPIILEDDTNGAFQLAQWSAQECAWVGENGTLCRIAPKYWHAVRRAEDSNDEYKSNGALQTVATLPSLNSPEPQGKAEASQVLALGSTPNSKPSGVATFDRPIPRTKLDPGQSRRRFALSCGTAMVVASLTAMYFRHDVRTYLAARADQQHELAVASVPEDRPWSMEHAPKTILALSEQPAGDSEGKLAKPTEEMLSNSAQQPAGAEVQGGETGLKDAESATTELRRSLQQAHDKIVALEDELSLARQHKVVHSSLSPRQARRIPHRRRHDLNRQGFFGGFNFAANHAGWQRTGR